MALPKPIIALCAVVLVLVLSASEVHATVDLFQPPYTSLDLQILTNASCQNLNNPNSPPCPPRGACSFCNSSCPARAPRSCDSVDSKGWSNCTTPYGCARQHIIQFQQGTLNQCLGKLASTPPFRMSNSNSNQNSASQYACGASSSTPAECCNLCKTYSTQGSVPADSNFSCKAWLFVVPNTPTENSLCTPSSSPPLIDQGADTRSVVTPYYGGCGWCLLMPRSICEPDCDTKGLDPSIPGRRNEQNTYWALWGRQTCAYGKNDPHFTGADGARFEFNGFPNKSFCLVADKELQINMKMHGYLDERTVGASILKDGKAVRTWMRELGFVWTKDGQKHTLLLGARAGPQQEYGEGFLAKAVHDGTDIPKMQAGSSVTLPSGMSLTFEGVEKRGPYDMEKYKLSIEGLLALDLSIRLAHPLLQTPEDAEAHFNIMIDNLKQTDTIHGVIGQTYRSGRTIRALEYRTLSALLGHPVAADGESGLGYLDGSVGDYETTDVLSHDCKYSSFSDT